MCFLPNSKIERLASIVSVDVTTFRGYSSHPPSQTLLSLYTALPTACSEGRFVDKAHTHEKNSRRLQVARFFLCGVLSIAEIRGRSSRYELLALNQPHSVRVMLLPRNQS